MRVPLRQRSDAVFKVKYVQSRRYVVFIFSFDCDDDVFLVSMKSRKAIPVRLPLASYVDGLTFSRCLRSNDCFDGFGLSTNVSINSGIAK